MLYILHLSNLLAVTAELVVKLTTPFEFAVIFKSENDTHKIPIMYTVDKVLGRKNEPKSTQLKVAVDRALNEIFGPGVMSQVSLTQKLKLRKLYLYILFYLFQKVVSKMDKFERTLV